MRRRSQHKVTNLMLRGGFWFFGGGGGGNFGGGVFWEIDWFCRGRKRGGGDELDVLWLWFSIGSHLGGARTGHPRGGILSGDHFF